MRKRFVALIAAAACAAHALPAHAQSDTLATRRVQLLQRLPAGSVIRITSRSHTLTGALLRVSADSVYLENGALPVQSIDNVWLRQRATRSGARWGAIIGAPAGAVFGGFVLLLVSALCESDCNDFNAGGAVLAIAGFGAAGLVAGGTVGAVVGAGIPQWVDITSRRARAPTTGTIGTVSLTPAIARPSEGEGSGVGARLSYLFQTRHISAGPDLGWYSLGTSQRTVFVGCQNGVCEDTLSIGERVSHAGGVLRVGTGSDRRIEPYGTLGIGFYRWSDELGGDIVLGGYSAGAGLQLRNRTGKQSLLVEARWQSNLTSSGDPDPHFGFYTIGIGGALAW